jgi:hypothetical protein
LNDCTIDVERTMSDVVKDDKTSEHVA